MFDYTLDDPYIKSLACAALNTGLRSILIFDAPYVALQQLAEILAQMLTAVTEQVVEQDGLSPVAQDDDLWGQLLLPGMQEDSSQEQLVFRVFSRKRNSSNLQLIAIPDLTKLSLAAARACIMLIGANVVHLERHGQGEHWQPKQCWLAGCSSQEKDVGAISPHLLDRFVLRLFWKGLESSDRHQRIADLIAGIHANPSHNMTHVPSELLQRISQAARNQVSITAKALSRVLEYIPEEQYYPRRELTLARFALTLAQLAGDEQMIPDHVDEAAAILGLVEPEAPALKDDEPLEEQLAAQQLVNEEEPSQLADISTPAAVAQRDPPSMIIAQTQDKNSFGSIASLGALSNPYLEDEAPIEREAASLKIPLTRSSPAARSDRGPINGVEPSETLRDLAIVSTLMTAAMFQKVRGRKEGGRLVLKESDLRRYRRGSLSEHMLVLLLDYTSLGDCNWQDVLLPYLSEAYANRSSIAVVKVGAANASNDLQAELVNARNILGQQVSLALEASCGRATPLAHGLELALQTMHRVLQHGRSAVQQVSLIVISDGRGNVPLEASLRGELHTIVTRKGIEDALRIAQSIRELKHLETFLLNPQPRHYRELPYMLAEALGAQPVDIPSFTDGWGGES